LSGGGAAVSLSRSKTTTGTTTTGGILSERHSGHGKGGALERDNREEAEGEDHGAGRIADGVVGGLSLGGGV